jgi:Lar family restriction alleviation protein
MEENIDIEDRVKPCPFCGYKPELKTLNMVTADGKYKIFTIRCRLCGCTIDFTRNNTLYWSEEQALENVISRWNDRKGE